MPIVSAAPRSPAPLPGAASADEGHSPSAALPPSCLCARAGRRRLHLSCGRCRPLGRASPTRPPPALGLPGWCPGGKGQAALPKLSGPPQGPSAQVTDGHCRAGAERGLRSKQGPPGGSPSSPSSQPLLPLEERPESCAPFVCLAVPRCGGGGESDARLRRSASQNRRLLLIVCRAPSAPPRPLWPSASRSESAEDRAALLNGPPPPPLLGRRRGRLRKSLLLLGAFLGAKGGVVLLGLSRGGGGGG